MKLLLSTILVFSTYLFASKEDEDKKKNILKQIEKEKRYAREQKFYSGAQYNFKDAEVDENALKKIPDQPDYNEDFDMDSVYD